MDNQYKPLDTLEISIRFWWLVAALMVLGGAIGYFIYSFVPSEYESKAVFSVLIDFNKTRELTDIEEDQMMVTAGDVFLSTRVVERVVQEAGKAGIALTPTSFRQLATIDHTNSDWNLRIRSNDPDIPSKLVNIWAVQSEQVMKAGLQHALLADSYNKQLVSLQTGLEHIAGVVVIYENQSRPDMVELIQTLSINQEKEKEQSLGLAPYLTVTLIQQAEGQANRVGEGRSISVLLGAGLGLIGYVLLAVFYLPGLKTKRSI